MRRVSGMRWPLGLAAGLAIVVLMNVVLVWLAVQHPPQIEPSYDEEAR